MITAAAVGAEQAAGTSHLLNAPLFMPEEKAAEIRQYRPYAWAFIIWNLDIQFPPGPNTPELIWILKELG
eukprot:9056986-Heterocapsa_arctica.AAC.1